MHSWVLWCLDGESIANKKMESKSLPGVFRTKAQDLAQLMTQKNLDMKVTDLQIFDLMNELRVMFA